MTTTATAPPLTSPWKGLAPYDDSHLDELLFFGRGREVEVACANLTASRLTVLFGATGVGKSSLLRAGVMRRLRETAAGESAAAIVSSWAGDPVESIAGAVRSAVEEATGRPIPDATGTLAERLRSWTDELGGPLYLVLDQLEEEFLYHADEDGPGSFVQEFPPLVTERGLPVHVLIGIREDSLGRLDTLRAAIPGVLSNYLRLERLDRDAARTAILGPIARWNELVPDRPMTAEPALVEAVLDEVAAGRIEPDPAGIGGVTPSALVERIEAPYLQLVLERLWEVERAEGSSALRRETLRRLGGAGQIVEQHLGRSLARLDDGERDAAAALFSYLVTPSGTKIAYSVDDLASYVGMPVASTSGLVGELVEERILRPTEGARVEIYHDVLAEAVADWRREHQATRELERARRRHRRLIVLFAIALVALVAVAAVALYALTQRSEARHQAARARDEARSAQARELGAEATSLLSIDPELGLLLAARGARLSPTAQAADILRRALMQSKLRGVLPVQGATTAAFSPDGTRIVVGSRGGDARIFSRDGRRLLATLPTGGQVTGASFSPDGRLVVTTQAGGPARVWRAADGAQVRTLGRAPHAAAFSGDGALLHTVEPGAVRVWQTEDGTPVATLRQPGPIRAASFGPGGHLVVTVGSDRLARLFRTDTGALVTSVDQGGGVTSATITPNGRYLVTTGRNKTARIWELGTRPRLLHELRGHVGQVTAGVLDRRGKRLVTTSTDGTARLWRVPTGELLTDFIGHTNQVTGAAFSRDGYSMVTTSTDRTARVWQPGRGAARALLAGHTDSVTAATFDPAGKRVLTVSADGTARVWDPQLQPELRLVGRTPAPVRAAAVSRDRAVAAAAGPTAVTVVSTTDGNPIRVLPTGPVRTVAVSPDGAVVAAAAGRRVTLWRAATGRRVGVVQEAEPTTAVAFTGDGRRIAVGTAGGAVRIWSLDGRRLRSIVEDGPHVTSLAFAPGDDRLAGASADGRARVWRVRDGRELLALTGHERGAALTSVAFGSTGRRIVTAGRDHDARVWAGATGTPLAVLRGHFATVNGAAFSPDGRWVVTAGPGTAGLWDTSTGELALFLRGHTGPLVAATFDATGRRITTVGTDGTVRLYACAICGGMNDLLPLARRRLAATGRAPTPAERRRYLAP